MRFAVAAAAATLVAGASATYSNTTIYTTEVVTAYTTYCPAATSIVHGTQTYVVTEVCFFSQVCASRTTSDGIGIGPVLTIFTSRPPP